MMPNSITPKTDVKSYILLLLGLVFWGMMAYLMGSMAIANGPNITDDFCFAWVGKEYGIFGGAYQYYIGWSGRFFGNVILHLNPLIFSPDFGYFKWGTWIVMALSLANTLYLSKNIFQKPWWNPTVLWSALIFQAIGWYTIPGFYEWYFWFSGLFYPLSFQLVILFFNLYYFEKAKWIRFFILPLVLFLLIGSSEITMIFFSAVFGCLQLYRVIQNRRIEPELWILGIVWVIALALVILAPGNAIRATKHIALLDGLVEAAKNAMHQFYLFLKEPLFWLMNIWILLFGTGKKQEYPVSWPLFLGLFGILVLGYYLSFLPISLALDETGIPNRTLSLLFMYLLMGSSFLSFVLHQKLAWSLPSKAHFPVQLIIMFMILPNMHFSKSAHLMATEISSGTALQFAKEQKARFLALQENKDELVEIPAIQTKSAFLFNEEISTDSSHLWCKCIAKYYDKKHVRLKNN
ncbi:DUF6056 family protein [Aquirufa aurantiipilula]|uniref:DUF6056 family protein n=1 Tax=Aquirufa aurantiipilula TaxID=2696561 RepID=UPI001CAA5F95|nr:DUF6056 family protein [Aquirufa aurantiipilula]MBZ1326533.1 hypothetical protein [Aquirufa aurantiipilula]